MARNEEKAQSMLYRFRKAMQAEDAGWVNPTPNEPLVPSTCQSLPAALYARKELTKDITRKIALTYDEDMDEAALRILNDEINKMIRVRAEWDAKVRDLGHEEKDKKIRWGDVSLPEPGNVHETYYFGRAKELPEVRDILQPRREGKVTLGPRARRIKQLADANYYGDEGEEDLLEAEKAAEQSLLHATQPLQDWVTKLPTLLPPLEGDELPVPRELHIPSQAEVEQEMLQRRKAALLKKYVAE